ncbi:MAG TPA: hypothetical protein VLR52_00425, partial [Bacteroidales bacterium]|nr:hypothetical protein [Bacteroidales bacterium]
IMTINTPAAVVSEYPFDLFSVKTDRVYQAQMDMKAFPGIISVNAFGQTVHVAFKKGSGDYGNLASFLEKKNHGSIRIDQITPDIEDCFMQLMTK